MVNEIIDEMTTLVTKMQGYIKQDIEDIKQGKHEQLLNRNEEKEFMIEKIANYKKKLNQEIVNQLQNGVDVNIYRDEVDNLEKELKNLYKLNRKLALIVEPIQQMYKEIVNEITEKNGGNIFHVKA